ncbi:MAG: recombinase family protein [Bacteroidales bacterium]|nr:recombinase family protein [Bacteroidales bacterium]
MKTIIFARVSTNIQEYDRQVNELTALANSKGWSVEAVFAEKISGAKANAERTELLNMVEYVEANAIDKVLVTELSRLWRDSSLEICQKLQNLLFPNGVLWDKEKDNYRTFDGNEVQPTRHHILRCCA